MAVTAETDMYTGEKHSAIAGKPSTHSLQRRIDLRCEDTLSVTVTRWKTRWCNRCR